MPRITRTAAQRQGSNGAMFFRGGGSSGRGARWLVIAQTRFDATRSGGNRHRRLLVVPRYTEIKTALATSSRFGIGEPAASHLRVGDAGQVGLDVENRRSVEH